MNPSKRSGRLDPTPYQQELNLTVSFFIFFDILVPVHEHIVTNIFTELVDVEGANPRAIVNYDILDAEPRHLPAAQPFLDLQQVYRWGFPRKLGICLTESEGYSANEQRGEFGDVFWTYGSA